MVPKVGAPDDLGEIEHQGSSSIGYSYISLVAYCYGTACEGQDKIIMKLLKNGYFIIWHGIQVWPAHF